MYNYTYRVAQDDFFEWDDQKNEANLKSHGVDFFDAQTAFTDPKRLVFKDLDHSHDEDRFFCIGVCEGKIVTVRFTMREKRIRILGAGFWRKGKAMYEEKNNV